MNKNILHTSQMAHHAYPNFCSMKRLEVFPLTLDEMQVHRRATPSIKFAVTHLFTSMEKKQCDSKVYMVLAEPGIKHTNHLIPASPIIPNLGKTLYNNYSTPLFSRYCCVRKVVFHQCLCLYCQQHGRHYLPGTVRINSIKILLKQAWIFFQLFKKILSRSRSGWSYL